MSSEGEGKRRWSPTVEQVRILERVYKAGKQRPSTVEIHHITHLLSRHGCVQGINVFYWFKNRKARDKRNMHASEIGNEDYSAHMFKHPLALTGKWGGLKLNGSDQRRFMSSSLLEVAVAMNMKAVCVEVNGRREEKPLQTLQLFPPCEK